MDLMFCQPKPDANGQVQAVREGGMRRIDKILVEKGAIEGVSFISALAGQTDHVPFALSIKKQ